MNDTVEKDESGSASFDSEKMQVSVAQVTETGDGSLREQGIGEQFSEVFWANAVLQPIRDQDDRVCRDRRRKGRGALRAADV